MARLALIPKETLVKSIGSAYGSAANKIARILGGLDPASYTATAGGAALAHVRAIVADLDSRARGWAERAIKAAYRESRAVATTRLEAIGAKPPKPKRGATAAEVKASRERPHAKAVARFIRVTAKDYIKANRTILTTAGKYLALVQIARRKLDKVPAEFQAFSSEEVKGWLNKMLKGALGARTAYNSGEAHLTSKDIAAKIRAKLLGQIKGQDFIRITGKDGVARNYNLKSYSELVARTQMRQSQTEAVKKSCAEYDNDLVEIPPHSDPCPLCAPRQGKVYSISGKHPDYPELPDGGPPWHPNCEDVANPTSERALRWRNK